MNKRTFSTDEHLKSSRHIESETKLPSLSSRDVTKAKSIITKRQSTSLLSSPIIEKSTKNLLLMRQLDPTGKGFDDESEEDSVVFLRKLESGKKKKVDAELTLLTKNVNKKDYVNHPVISQSLVGEQAVQKFYERYRGLQKRTEKEDFLQQKHAITSIATLLQLHNFTPRKMTLVKMQGEETILDLRKLGIGQGSIGPVVSEILSSFKHFNDIDLSYNRIYSSMSEEIIQKLARVKKINLSHNRISKVGCEKFASLFLDPITNIKELYLQENSLLDSAGVILIQNLRQYDKLQILSLNKNYMGLKFAQKINKFLKSGDSFLKQLYLSWNQFSSKAVRMILQGIVQHSHLKVFDFSWNKIQEQNAPLLSKIFLQSDNLVHADFSFCELSLKSITLLAAALNENKTLYGLHVEGNSGFIDSKGFLIKTEKQFNEYPLPIIKGIIRRINGVRPNPNNSYKGSTIRDICWICHSWQQKYFSLTFSESMKEQAKEVDQNIIQCLIHFKHQQYRAVKMILSSDGTKFQVDRMCPIGWAQFFFTFSLSTTNRNIIVSQEYQILSNQIQLHYFIGNVQIHNLVKQRNISFLSYEVDPISEQYEPNIDITPRSVEVQLGIKERLQKKRKVLKEEKVQVNFKDLDDEEDQFLQDKSNDDKDDDFISKCIEFDIKNSKIPKLIKDPTIMNQFKYMMLRYYKSFKDTFYFLARNNPTANGIYSISQLQFIGFLDEQKYITKRVTQPKIMLKLYACLSDDAETQQTHNKKGQEKVINKLLSRPQFLQFLIRLAIEKWCSFIPKKNTKPQLDKNKLIEEEYHHVLNLRRNNSKLMASVRLQKIDKQENKLKKSPARSLEAKDNIKNQRNSKPVLQPIQLQKEEDNEQQMSEQEEEVKKSKLQLPLPLIDGIERTLKTLPRYASIYSSSNWRLKKYLKLDILIVFRAYEQFLNALYQNYTNSNIKTDKPKKLVNLLTLNQLKNIFLDTDIRKTKQAMKDIEQAFISSKRLTIEDGNLQFGLSFQQFQECMARISQKIWINPLAAPKARIWDKQINRKNAPLFLKLQSLIIALYWRSPDLHNRRMTKIAEKGIFQLQITTIMQKIEALNKSSQNSAFNLKSEMISQEEQISLKEIIEELKQKYQNMVVHKQVEEIYQEDCLR